jgi:periplasmic divalent cation tolerance protein
MNKIIIYVTCASQTEAEKIAGDLVEKRLVACANIMSAHTAVYEWNGELEKLSEVSMILKTRGELFEKVRERICKLHSYECPCIVALPILAGHEPFLQWISKETEE